MNKIGIAACFAVLALGFGMATADDSTVIPGTDPAHTTGKDAAELYSSRCQSCHGADGNRVAAQGTASLEGQSQEELMHKLKGYKNGTYGGPRKEVMVNVVDSLSDAQLKELADYIPTL